MIDLHDILIQWDRLLGHQTEEEHFTPAIVTPDSVYDNKRGHDEEPPEAGPSKKPRRESPEAGPSQHHDASGHVPRYFVQ